MIQAKPIKDCKNPVCNNTFKPYRSTDKFCSFQCAAAAGLDRAVVKKQIKQKYHREPTSRIQAKHDAKARDSNMCQLRPYLPAELQHDKHTISPQVHHIIFLSEQGPDELWNLITLCSRCHHDIAHRYKKDWQRKLLEIVNGENWYIKIMASIQDTEPPAYWKKLKALSQE